MPIESWSYHQFYSEGDEYPPEPLKLNAHHMIVIRYALRHGHAPRWRTWDRIFADLRDIGVLDNLNNLDDRDKAQALAGNERYGPSLPPLAK